MTAAMGSGPERTGRSSGLPDGIARAAVIGAGTMGRGIAQALALNGVAVALSDRDPDLAVHGRAALLDTLGAAVRDGALLAGQCAAAASLVRAADGLPDAVRDADLVIEAVPEMLDLKQRVWVELARHLGPKAVAATNTSSFDIDAVVGPAGETGRALGTHWYNPAYLVPCVEVVPAARTAPDVVTAVLDFLRWIGKAPAVTANTAGFVGNRIQFAMIAEAFRCLGDGVATAEDIDSIVRNSFGFRLGDYGPFQVADMNGLDVYQSILDYLAEHLGDRFAPPENLIALHAAGRLGVKSGAGVYTWPPDAGGALLAERDRRLRRRIEATEASPDGNRS